MANKYLDWLASYAQGKKESQREASFAGDVGNRAEVERLFAALSPEAKAKFRAYDAAFPNATSADRLKALAQYREEESAASTALAKEQDLLKQQTSRQLGTLRTELSGQMPALQQSLARGLAGRGLLDSGGLGYGTTKLASGLQGQLAGGTQAALMGESDYLQKLLGETRGRAYDAQQAMLNRAYGSSQARYQADLQKQLASQKKKKWYDYLLPAVGTGVGMGLGGPLGGAIGGWMGYGGGED